MSAPRVALVCDWLTTPGGAEKVLLELHRLYPEAPIYTSQYRPRRLTWFRDATVRTGWLNLFPAGLRKLLGPLRQLYFSRLDLSDFDLVISVTGAEAKAVRTESARHKAVHLCYCHAPTQYYWAAYAQYLAQPGFGPLAPLARLGLRLFVKPLRRADFRAAQRPDRFITISSDSAAAIQRYYHRDSVMIPPPVDLTTFSASAALSAPGNQSGESAESTEPTESAESAERQSASATSANAARPEPAHSEPAPAASANTARPESAEAASAASAADSARPFVISCRQVTWKRVDLAIQACLQLGQPLLVIGDGPEHARLVKLAAASPLIGFLPWLSASALARQLQSARAYIFPSHEPFGIAAVEALAAGCPVIAYACGGSRDIVQPGRNGAFFASQTVAALAAALAEFNPADYDPAVVRASAERFAAPHFDAAVQALVAAVLPARAAKNSRKTP